MARNFTSTANLANSPSASLHSLNGYFPLPPLHGFFPKSHQYHIRDVFGDSFDFRSFQDLVKHSISRFSASDIRSRAIQASVSSPTVDYNQIARDSLAFEIDPIGTIESYASKSIGQRLNFQFLSSPVFNDFVDISTLRSIATTVDPIFDPSFSPSTEHAQVRPQLAPLTAPILSLFQTNYAKGEVLLVYRESFIKATSSSGLPSSLSNIWHTEKYMNDLGRLLYDYTNISTGTPVNSDLCRDSYRLKYGRLVYPTTSDYILMLWHAKRIFPGQKIFITKSDVHRAYHRFRWSSKGSLLLALLVSDTIVAIPITGGFGSNGPPFIYDVASRFFQHHHNRRMLLLDIPVSLGGTYVDDFAFYGPLSFSMSELQAHETLVNSVLGPSAAHRSEQSTSLDVIGTRFDSVRDTVGISPKGYLKLVFFFFSVLPADIPLSKKFPLSIFQILAGLTNRYGFFIPLLRHTSHVFYRLLRGPPRSRVRSFSKNSLPFVTLWRAFLFHAFSHAHILSTPTYDYFHNCSDSYNPELLVSTFSSYSDSTLHTIGLYVPLYGWCEVSVSDFASDSSFSIAILEFVAVILSFMFAHQLKPDEHSIHLYVDNQNAESWSRGRFHSDSNLLLGLITFNSILQTKLSVTQTRAYIRSELNTHADSISRKCYPNSDHIPQYFVTSPILKSLKSLLSTPDPNPFVVHQILLTISLSEGFSLTSI